MEAENKPKYARQKRYFKTQAGIEKTREASRKYYGANRDVIIARRAAKRQQSKDQSQASD